MTIVNTLKTLRDAVSGQPAPAPAPEPIAPPIEDPAHSHDILDLGHTHDLGPGEMPDEDDAPEVGPDDTEDEGEFDREGNTDPQTNQPPAPVDEPEAEEAVAKPGVLKLSRLHYTSFDTGGGKIHAVGIAGNGENFNDVVDAPQGADLYAIGNYLERLRRLYA